MPNSEELREGLIEAIWDEAVDVLVCAGQGHMIGTSTASVIIEGIVDALLSQSAGEDGWRLVPVEPTEAMLDAFHDALHGCQNVRFSECATAGLIAAIAAAPTPQVKP